MEGSATKSWQKLQNKKTKQRGERSNMTSKEDKADKDKALSDLIEDLNEELPSEHRIFYVTGVGMTTEKMWKYTLLGWRCKKDINGHTLLVDCYGMTRYIGKDIIDVLLQLSIETEGEYNDPAMC